MTPFNMFLWGLLSCYERAKTIVCFRLDKNSATNQRLTHVANCRLRSFALAVVAAVRRAILALHVTRPAAPATAPSQQLTKARPAQVEGPAPK